MVNLSTPVEYVPKISRKIIPALKRLGIHTIRDLLFHFPSRYEDFSNVKNIHEVVVGETVTIRGAIQKISSRRTLRRRMMLTEAIVEDETGMITALWFNQAFLMRNMKPGQRVSLSGKVVEGSHGLYLQNPAYEKISSASEESVHTSGLVAVYPETQGITSRWLRFLVNSFIDMRSTLIDPLPDDIRKSHDLPRLADALYSIHFPETIAEADEAKRRFSFHEIFLLQIFLLRERARLKEFHASAIALNIPLVKKFVSSLPYELTDAQRRSLWEILQDISHPRPMNRLLEGDVGSGKTVVAAGATLVATAAGFRVVFMAPTEILARQHYETLLKTLATFDVTIGLLVGSEKRVRHDPDIIVGTHALLESSAHLENVALVIIDEQHRFGVDQRAKLVARGKTGMLPHFLSMTATPIPRTLALTAYGDLDVSLLDQMPKSRKQIITRIVEPGARKDMYQFIRSEVRRGRQVFVICPRIEISKPEDGKAPSLQKLMMADVKAVTDEYKNLSEKIFPDLRIAMLHGKLKHKEKDATMRRFKKHEFDILVSTSVIEVGVDVPNATIMLIEGAERFGLAQLHQFRGRVGRGEDQSYCFLLPTGDDVVTRRLKAVIEAKTGFELAEKDLEIRGPGDFIGGRQSGIPDFAFSSLTDTKLIREIREAAKKVLAHDPELQKYPALRGAVDVFQKKVHLE